MNIQIEQSQSVVDSLRELVNSYLTKHPNISIQALALKANVPVTSLRRLVNEESKSEIAPHTVLNLCSYIVKEKKIQALLTKVQPAISEFLTRHFGQFIFSHEERVYSVDLNTELRDRLAYFIYKLAANHQGTSLIEVTELFGVTGKKKADEMKSKGLLVEKADRLHAKEKNFSLDLKIAADHMPELVKFYKPEAVSQGKNLFYSLSEALTEEAIKEIKDVQREAVKKIHSIMSDEKNAGQIPYFTLNLAETFLSEEEGVIQ
jgi:hypothetical protein